MQLSFGEKTEYDDKWAVITDHITKAELLWITENIKGDYFIIPNIWVYEDELYENMQMAICFDQEVDQKAFVNSPKEDAKGAHWE